ncbi:MAG: DUF433 domain-containing protein [Chloroflexi bacterium]|nr:DUF433 domain-containing protein [Chloroflexota bacterium]
MTTRTVRKKNKKAASRFIGRYVVTDPEICHGKPTFRGTRILVSQSCSPGKSGVSRTFPGIRRV